MTAGLSPDNVAAAAGRLSTRLRVGLGRSIGREGFRALFERAMSQLQADDEPLVALGILRGDEVAKPTGPGQAYGAAGVAAGMVALVATVIDLLSRIVGEEVALRLVENAGAPIPHGVADPEILGAHDG